MSVESCVNRAGKEIFVAKSFETNRRRLFTFISHPTRDKTFTFPTTPSIKMVLPTPENPRIIALFDVDGTLTIPRGEVKQDMMDTLKALREKITVGIVGGSDLPKQEEQLGEGIVDEVVWNFSQNGLVAYNNGNLLESNSISKHLGEDNIKRIVNWVMKYLADVDLPVKVRA